ncbi:MAG: response regulator [Candidatus Eisenbacteria bacterium]|nr:response regulator [Candidatus Eisenbacteria bacterium]
MDGHGERVEARFRILHLEDDPQDAILVHHALAAEGIDADIRTVGSRADFLRELEKAECDLILADYRLPAFDGLEALEMRQSRLPSVPFVFVTGALGEELATETLRRGATDYVLKDRLSRLGSVVRRALGEAQEQKRRREVEQALRVSEERFRIALSNSAISVHSCDADLRYVWVYNPWDGLTAGQMEGKRDDELFAPENVRELTDLKCDVLRSGARIRRQITIRIDETGTLCYDVTAEPLFGPSGVISGVTAAMTDVTELVRAKAAAEEANRAKDYFLAVLSHELRTPLTPVLATIGMLQSEVGLAPQAREGLAVIRRNVELEARLIDDLLDLTRIARGKIELSRRPLDLAEVLREAIEVCHADLEAADLDLEMAIEPGPFPVEGDGARLQQVLWNLLKNAIKFTPPGGRVRVSCRRDGGSTVLAEIEDDGAGIEPSLLERIFDAFEQAEAPRKLGGLGLGLAISKALVELHGGSIEARSGGKGLGSLFLVRLPLDESAALASTARSVPPPAEEKAPALRLKILLVEDHEDTVWAMERLLGLQGHEVQTASSVAAGVEIAHRERFDLLISDLGLPDGSGLDLMARIRDLGIRLPAIALSGHGQEQDVDASLLAGFLTHLTKPVEPSRLLQTILSVAESHGVSIP